MSNAIAVLLLVFPFLFLGWYEWSSRREHAWKLHRDALYLAELRRLLTDVAGMDSKTAYTQALGTAMAEAVRSVREGRA